MLKSSNVLDVKFNENQLEKLSSQRLKALKMACYSFVGSRFYCCEYHCEFILRDEKDKSQYKMYTDNLGLISKAQKKFNV